jgi:hypothetical protein
MGMTPGIFDIIRMPKDLGDLPAPINPYYVIDRDGHTWLHKQNPIGKFLVPVKSGELPDSFYGEGPTAKALIWREFDPLPGWLIGQTVNFFKRIYQKQGTEAEVLITFNPDADPKYRLFVPHQRVSGGSVRSIHDAGHFQRGWQLFGSIHSHANMNAFHSGTDTNDASEFPGLHITIGDFGRDNPSFAAMVMVNGIQWDYDIDKVADTSQIWDHTSPGWWDRYIVKDNTPPKSKNLTTTAIDHWNGTRSYSFPRTQYTPSGYQTMWKSELDLDDEDYTSLADYYQLADIEPRARKPIEQFPRPANTRPGYRYSGQLGGIVREHALQESPTGLVIRPEHAPAAFFDRLNDLEDLAERFGFTLLFDLLDPAGYSYLAPTGGSLFSNSDD